MSNILEILSKYNIRPSKRLGQNFLVDLNIADKIIKGAGIDKKTTVLEIGGGVGSLTGGLLECAGKVIVVELDPKMCQILSNEYKGNIEIINKDILKTDVNSILKEETNVKVCGNLPYYITTPIIMYFLEERFNVKSLTFMMQKEVADRVMALPGSKDYGAITPVINYYANVKLIAVAPPNCFVPRPKVQSSVVHFDILEEKKASPNNENLMFSVIKASFQQRRKTILNALSNCLPSDININKEQIIQCLEESSISPDVRGETLGLLEFCTISNAIGRATGL